METKKFILLGAAGYIAPKHMQAIKENGWDLVAALDPHDSVGILDRYFPKCRFFTEFERLDRFADKLVSNGDNIDYVSIASPNYLHDSQCRWAMRIGADAICEKPVVLNLRNLYALKSMEQRTGRRVWTVLQLRYHDVVKFLKEKYSIGFHQVSITYITPRGHWYENSWKTNTAKSGGLCSNIGVHLFDVLGWVFGSLTDGPYICKSSNDSVKGVTHHMRATVKWDLSIDINSKPTRILTVDGEDYDLSAGFTDLHTEVYTQIANGNGYGLDDAMESIKIIERIRGLDANRPQ